jgi:hypothetical protein
MVFTIRNIKNFKSRNLKLVAHACNPSYSGGRDQEDHGMKSDGANSLGDPILKITNTKKGLVEKGKRREGWGRERKGGEDWGRKGRAIYSTDLTKTQIKIQCIYYRCNFNPCEKAVFSIKVYVTILITCIVCSSGFFFWNLC